MTSLHLHHVTVAFLSSTTKIKWPESQKFISGCFLMPQVFRDYTFFFPLQEKIKRIQQIRMEKELRAQQILEVQNLIQQHL